jgi:hypothetical protein
MSSATGAEGEKRARNGPTPTRPSPSPAQAELKSSILRGSLYAKDSDWKERLDSLARRASWILVEIGNSDALGWEFDHLKREGLQQKVFIITPPAREVARFVWWFIDFNRYINGMGAVSWLQFCERIAPFGYKMDRTDPGPSAVVTFDDNAKSVVLIRDAKTPEEFVQAMRSWTSGIDNKMRSKTIHSA